MKIQNNKIALSLSLYRHISSACIITTNYNPEEDIVGNAIIAKIRNTKIWIIGIPAKMCTILPNGEFNYLLKKTNNCPYDEYYLITETFVKYRYERRKYDLFKQQINNAWNYATIPYEFCKNEKCKYILKCLLNKDQERKIGYIEEDEKTIPLPCRSYTRWQNNTRSFKDIIRVKPIPNSKKFFQVIQQLINNDVPLDKLTPEQLFYVIKHEYESSKKYSYFGIAPLKFIEIVKQVWKNLDIFIKIQKEHKEYNKFPVQREIEEEEKKKLYKYCEACDFGKYRQNYINNYKYCLIGNHPSYCEFKKYIDKTAESKNLFKNLFEEIYKNNKEKADKIAYFFEHTWPIKYGRKKISLQYVNLQKQIIKVKTGSGNFLEISFDEYEKLRKHQQIIIKSSKIEKWLKGLLYILHYYDISHKRRHWTEDPFAYKDILRGFITSNIEIYEDKVSSIETEGYEHIKIQLLKVKTRNRGEIGIYKTMLEILAEFLLNNAEIFIDFMEKIKRNKIILGKEV